jgi:integrase
MRRNLNYFGDKRPLADITTEVIDDYILHLKDQRLSGATINRVLMNLSRILRTAREYGKMEHQPVIHRQPEGEHRLRWLTDDEVDAMIGAAQEYGYLNLRDAIIVSVDTGVRRGELQRIRKRDITQQGLGVWESKNMTGRVIPLTKRARGILEMRDGDLLFPQNDFIRSAWDRVKHHVGVGDDVVWHTLRHTFASRLVQKNVPIQVVQKLMGHKTIQITMRYAKIHDNNLISAISAIDNISNV